MNQIYTGVVYPDCLGIALFTSILLQIEPCLTQFFSFSLVWSQRQERTQTMRLSMSVWRVFAKYMRNIWKGWTQTHHQSPMTSVSCLISLINCRISPVLFIRKAETHMLLSTRIGSKRRFTFFWGDKPMAVEFIKFMISTKFGCLLIFV